MRTPHGDADVSIVAHSPTTTIGEVVSAVTGQAVPRLVLIDHRAVDANALLDDVQLVVGAVVTTEPSIPPIMSIADTDIVQIAGHGAGRVMRLGPGRYRIGPGRRAGAEELDVGVVERTMFELVVDPTAAASEVTIVPVAGVPEGGDLVLDGDTLTDSQRWDQETLTVGLRAFQLDNPARSDLARSLSKPGRDGTVAFSRPPRRRSAPDRRPVIDALHDATLAASTLWERRPNHSDAFVLPIGVRSDSADIVTADLGADRAMAITGSERFRGGLARTLVVEAATLHGPADLDLVILADPDRLAQWDWVKWLPHVRLDGPPAIWSSQHDIARWADGVGGGASWTTAPWNSSHLTVVILDDAALWNRRDSPLHAIVSNPPDDLRLIVLCDDATQAPASCTTVISETADGLARLHAFAGADDDGAVRAALTETAVAVRVARALAPLADLDLPATPPAMTIADDRVDLWELIGVAEYEDILARWATDDSRPTVAIGRREHATVEIPVADDVTVVIGSSMGDAFDVAAALLVAQCADRSPDAMWIVPLMLGHGPRSELLWQFPHATDPHDLNTAIEPSRLLARLRTVLAEPDGPDRIVLVAEAASGAGASSVETWLGALAVGVRATSGLAMVVITDRSDMTHEGGDTVIRVERRDETARPDTRRVASVLTPGGVASETFTPLQRTTSPIATLELRPYVVGRALTTLERRIEQQRTQSANTPEPELGAVVTLLRDAASRHRSDGSPRARSDRKVVPPTMPSRVDLVELFDSSPGDGVPLGVVDDPGTGGVRTRWWEPASGSLLVFGSRRSGIEQTLATIVLGVIDRFSTLDVRLVVIEHSSTRRRALSGVDHAMRLVAPDQADDVVGALDEIAAELDRHAGTNATEHDGPRLVVVIGDLVYLRRRYADQPVGTRIDEMITAAASPGCGIDVVAYAADLDGAGPFAAIASSRLVGASSDHDELLALGVEHPGELEGVVGRCRSFPGNDLVQLATADATTEMLLAARSNGGNR